MTTSLDRLRGRFDEWHDDPDYLYEGIVLNLTEQIAARMADKDIHRSDLAERLGTSRAYVTKLLDGQQNMTLKTLIRVAGALEMKVDARFVPSELSATTTRKSQRVKTAVTPRMIPGSPAKKRVVVAARTKR